MIVILSKKLLQLSLHIKIAGRWCYCLILLNIKSCLYFSDFACKNSSSTISGFISRGINDICQNLYQISECPSSYEVLLSILNLVFFFRRPTECLI